MWLTQCIVQMTRNRWSKPFQSWVVYGILLPSMVVGTKGLTTKEALLGELNFITFTERPWEKHVFALRKNTLRFSGDWVIGQMRF